MCFKYPYTASNSLINSQQLLTLNSISIKVQVMKCGGRSARFLSRFTKSTLHFIENFRNIRFFGA